MTTSNLILTTLTACRGLQRLRGERSYDSEGASPDRGVGTVYLRRPLRRDADRDLRSAINHPRFPRHKTHKASSAEAILRHCLQRRGWTALWREGRLTGKQHLQLLEDIRLYGKRWLRHEAEGFFQAYGTNQSEGASRAQPGDPLASLEVSRSTESAATARSLGGRILSPLKRFFDRARSFIHELIIAGTMALKGNEPLSGAEVAAIDEQARIQAEYLANFQRQVISNPPLALIDPADLATTTTIIQPPAMTAPQFIARAESYGNSVWQSSINAGRESVKAGVQAKRVVFIGERRVHFLPLDKHPYCVTCKEQSDLGWQPLGSLNEIGDSECMGGCDCYFEWLAPDGSIFVSPWFQRHNPKGYPDTETGLPGDEQWGKWIGTQGTGTPTPAKQIGKPPRKITLKTTPYTEYHKIKREPTADEINAEIAKFHKGEPHKLAIKEMTPRITKPIPPDLSLPPGYTYHEAEYDAAGNLVVD